MCCVHLLLSFVLLVPAEAQAKPSNREEALRSLCARYKVGGGCAIADIGAGRGSDSWVFAGVVGPDGTVFANEIDAGKVKRIAEEAEKKKLPQVRAVLGVGDDPRLPEKSVDLIYMRRVYHHFAQPRPMLRGMWRALRPGGHLIIVDERRGTLRDWVPRERRAKKHFLIAETTVVREAREEGYAYVECAEDSWYESKPFVLVFRRPKDAVAPGRDPDPFLPLDVERTCAMLCPLDRPYRNPVFVALGEGRHLIPPLVEAAAGKPLEIVPEEWATQKEERPPLPEGVSFASKLPDRGDPGLGPEPIDAVYFLDTYHLLFHAKTLLGKLKEKVTAAGVVYVLDRAAPEGLSRREGSHRRMIAPERVVEEMREAGFHLWRRAPKPAPDRFLLCFGTVPPEEVWPETDPLVAGPVITDTPQAWLTANLWRLRGMRTAAGDRCGFGASDAGGAISCAPASDDAVSCTIPAQGLTLLFKRDGKRFRLADVVRGVGE
jgi:ubiquinone/menaquinone biosynthesis C-methylase UbiE